MRMLESEFNCCCQPDAELFSIHQQPIYITLRNSNQYSAWHTWHTIACKAHRGTLTVRESVSAISSQNPRHLKFHEHPKTIINKENRCLARIQGCIFRLTCSQHELTKDHVLTTAYVKFFRTVTRNAMRLKEKRLFLTSLKQICNEYLYLDINKCKNRSTVHWESERT